MEGVNFGGVQDKKFAPIPNEGNRCAYPRCSLGYELKPERGDAVRFAAVGIPGQWCHKRCAEQWEQEMRADRIAEASAPANSSEFEKAALDSQLPRDDRPTDGSGVLNPRGLVNYEREDVPDRAVPREPRFPEPYDNGNQVITEVTPERVVQFGEFETGRAEDVPRGTVNVPEDPAAFYDQFAKTTQHVVGKPIFDEQKTTALVKEAIEAELKLGAAEVPPAGELDPPDRVYVAPSEPNPSEQQQTITWTTELVAIFATNGVSFHAGVVSDLIDWKRRTA